MAVGTIYSPSTLGTTNNSITFNDDTSDPYFRVVSRYVSRREIEELDIKLPEGTGDADYQSYIGKSYLLIRGRMYPNTENSANDGKQALRKLASLDIQQEDTDSDQGYVPYKFDANVPQKIMVKVVYVDMQETTRGLKQDFTLVCKIKYPIIQAQSSLATTVGDSNATTSGASGYPFEYPIGYGKTTYSSNGTIYNTGDLSVYPSITINGPITTPRITNSTTGKYIELSVNLATTGDNVIILYDQDSLAITQAGNSKLNTLTSSSELFKIVPTENNLTLTGATVGSGAYASVTCTAAWPIS